MFANKLLELKVFTTKVSAIKVCATKIFQGFPFTFLIGGGKLANNTIANGEKTSTVNNMEEVTNNEKTRKVNHTTVDGI